MHVKNWKSSRAAQTIIARRAKHPERESLRQQEIIRMLNSRPSYRQSTKYSDRMVEVT